MWLYIILLILTFFFSTSLFVSITNMRFPKHAMAAKRSRGMFLFFLILLVLLGIIAHLFIHKHYFFIWFGGIILLDFIFEIRSAKKTKLQNGYFDQL